MHISEHCIVGHVLGRLGNDEVFACQKATPNAGNECEAKLENASRGLARDGEEMRGTRLRVNMVWLSDEHRSDFRCSAACSVTWCCLSLPDFMCYLFPFTGIK